MVDETTGTSDWVDRLFVYDGGGSVRALTDLEGNVTDTFSYDSFGNLLHPSSLILHTFYLYRGERYDPDLGQYYLRARFYDANLGRFHTLDEYEGRTGEPLSLHKYLYAHANPVTGWDPSGRMSLSENSFVSTIKAGFAKLARATLRIARRIMDLIPRPYFTLKYRPGYHRHHVIEKRFLNSNLALRKTFPIHHMMLAVYLRHSVHKVITAAWRRCIPYKNSRLFFATSLNEIENCAVKIYLLHPFQMWAAVGQIRLASWYGN